MTQKDALNFASDLREFVKSVLNTYIDVHTPRQEQNFVKNWQDSHEDKKILDFGPENEPANEDEDFQDTEGDSPIIININIDKLIW